MTGAPADNSGLVVEGLRIQFGGLVAVEDATLSAPRGRITGLIGPNGAGKTTTFNACSGLNTPTKGTITLFGQDVSKASPPQRARLGLGRTFQHAQICPGLTVRENVALGAEVRLIGRNPVRQLLGRNSDAADVRKVTTEALETCGIGHLADTSAAILSTGQRRLLELARVLAGQHKILLLDEPSSGLDEGETEQFGKILTEVVDTWGTGILIVEHDMALVMGICKYLYVLDFGKLIFEGTAAETQTSQIVRQAYLGEDLEAESA